MKEVEFLMGFLRSKHSKKISSRTVQPLELGPRVIPKVGNQLPAYTA